MLQIWKYWFYSFWFVDQNKAVTFLEASYKHRVHIKIAIKTALNFMITTICVFAKNKHERNSISYSMTGKKCCNHSTISNLTTRHRYRIQRIPFFFPLHRVYKSVRMFVCLDNVLKEIPLEAVAPV